MLEDGRGEPADVARQGGMQRPIRPPETDTGETGLAGEPGVDDVLAVSPSGGERGQRVGRLGRGHDFGEAERAEIAKPQGRRGIVGNDAQLTGEAGMGVEQADDVRTGDKAARQQRHHVLRPGRQIGRGDGDADHLDQPDQRQRRDKPGMARGRHERR